MAKIDVTVDAQTGIQSVRELVATLKATSDRVEDLDKVTSRFNKSGKLLTSTVESQVGAFGKLTQTVRSTANGLKVVASQYTENAKAARAAAEAEVKAAERAAEQRAKLRDRVDAADARALTKKYDAEEKARNRAIDKEYSASVKKAKKAEEDSQKEADRIAKQGSLLENTLQRIGRNLVQFASYKAFNAIVDGLNDGVRAAKDFQIQISLIRTISQDSQQSFVKFGDDIRRVSDATGIDVKDVGKAFYDATSNQVAKGANTGPFVQQAANLARATGSELPDSVNAISSRLNAYGLSASEAERVSAQLFKTVDEGRIVLSEVANTIGRVDVLARGLGVSMEDVNATLAITTQKGFTTSDAMTLLTNLLIKLEKPTEATQGFFKNILGVDSAEAAITMLGGLPQLMRRIVQEIKAGRVDVSAFFDEIRGRKQFAIFEQSIDQIEDFSTKLKDNGKVLAEYKQALKIRGESPADALVKEANKIANVFKVDIGQGVLKFAADLLQFTGGIDTIKQSALVTQESLKALSLGVVAYGTYAAGATIVNTGFAASFNIIAAGAGRALLALGPYIVAAGAAYVAYERGKKLFSEGSNSFGTIDPSQANATLEAVERYKRAATGLTETPDPFKTLTEQKETVNSSFKDVIGLISSANLANNKFLDDAKSKAESVSTSLKSSFGTFTDRMKNNISEIKKGITSAAQEIERSLKRTLAYNESIQEALFNTRLKYANEDFGEQKQRVLEERNAQLEARAQELYKEGTEESIAQADKLYQTLLSNTTQLFDLVQDRRKTLLERDVQSNPQNYQRPGSTILGVDTTELERDLTALAERRGAAEGTVRKNKEAQIALGHKQVEQETARLRNLEAAFKKYEDLEPTDKTGKVKREYQNKTGQFDPSKFIGDIKKIEDDIRGNVRGTFEERVQLEGLLTQKRQAALAYTGALERQEYLKTTEARVQAEKDEYEKRIEGIKRARDEAIKQQDAIFGALSQKQNEIRGFGNLVGEANKLTPEDKAEIEFAVKSYNEAFIKLRDNPLFKNGTSIADPARAADLDATYKDSINRIQRIRDRLDNGSGTLNTPSGTLNYGEAKAGTEQQLKELSLNSSRLNNTFTAEQKQKEEFDATVKGPLDELKKQFPDLARQAETNLPLINQQFRNLANGGVEDLKKQLLEIQRLLPKPGQVPNLNGKVGALEGEVTYAATGGIVGQFPGQPRGADIYPVWAARGETIVDAETSAQYRPMLQAIMDRRMPRYMAEGGVVGGDTTVGDINITVNGANTNNETARIIGNRLERQLRLSNIRLDRKRK